MDSSIDPMNILELRIKVEPPDDDAGPSTSPALNYNEISDEGEDYGELSKICRLCGVVPSKPTTVLKIFDNECARKEISEKINKYLPIQVSMEDPLPKTICADCIGLIENWDGLVKRTKIIEEKLKEKCRNDQRLPINKPTDTQENTNTNDEIVPIIENYTYIRDDLHGVTLTDAQSAVSPEPDFASDESRNTRKEYIEKPQTVLMKDGKKYGVCDVCQKGVMLASWRRHVRSHRSVKSFSCEACGLGFSDGGNLARHARALHGDDRPHACHICLKKFSRNSHLQDHIKSHFDSREFVCDLCGKASKSSSALRMHKRTHDDYKFHCMYCEAKFKRRAHLSAHVSVHTGEKAHECACGKTFRLRSQLTSHARVHERRDSFETPQFKAFVPLILLNWTYVDNRQSIWRWCYVCDKRFQREVFTTHVYTMHAEFQLHCEVCNTFVEKQEYVAHMSQHSYERSIEKEKHAKTTTKKILDVNLAWFVRHEFCDCKNIMCTFNKEMMYKICPTYIDYDCITETMAHILNTSLGKVRCAYEEHYIEHVTRRKKLVSLPTELNTIGTPRQTKIAGKISIRCLLNNLNNLVAIKRQSELHHYRVDCFKRRYGPDQKQLPGRPVRVYDANIQIKLELQDEVNNNANTTESNDDTNTPAVRRIERNRKCRFCGKVYTSSVDYFVHVRHAHKESQGLVAPSQPLPVFKCRDCNKRLRCRQSLLMHCRRHTGVKNYHCSSCDKSFRWRIHLEKHEKVHGPRVKYACPTCQKVFTVKCDLRKHQRKHVVKNFECTICKEKFTGDRYLKVHMTRKHKNGNESGGKIVKKVKGIKSTTDVGTRKPNVQARRVSTRNK